MSSIAQVAEQASTILDTRQELERLQALARYEIMDTPAEKDYDALITLLHDLLGADFTMLNFIDNARTWVKSSTGIDITELPRTQSICNLVVEDDEELYEVEHLQEDARTREIAQEMEFVSYVGMPVRAKGGERIGVIALGFVHHKKLDRQERKALRTLRRQVEVTLEQRRALNMVRRQQDALTQLAEQHQNLLSTMSHDTRNLLAGILSNCEFAIHQIDQHTEDAREAIEDALFAARQAKQLLHHIDASKRRFRQETPLNQQAIREAF